MTNNMKVAALFLAAVAGLVLIIMLLSGGAIRGAKTLYVTYNFAGGVQKGTPVRVAGIQVGKVRDIEFLGAEPDEDEHVRLTIHVDEKAMKSIRADSKFYINMAGIIGERYVEISTGSKDQPQIEPNSKVRGVDPPRLDQLISQGYAVAGEILDIIEKNRPKLENMITLLDAFLKNFDEKKIEKLPALLGNAAELMDTLNTELPPLLRKGRPVMDELAPLLSDLRAVLGETRKVLKDKDIANIIDQLLSMIGNLQSTLKGADKLVNNLTFIDENWVRHVLQVEGIKAYAGFGSPSIPDNLEPVPPPAFKKPGETKNSAAAR